MLSNQRNGAVIIEGHVQGLSNTRSLGEAGIPVFVVDKTNCIARYSKYCKKFFISPDFILDKFADFLIELSVKENIRDWILIPSNDHAVYTIAKHKKRLENYYYVTTPSLDTIENIYDKINLLKLAARVQVPFPNYQANKTTAAKIEGDLKFPVITKGRYGLSFYKKMGKKAFVANSEKELSEQFRHITSVYPLERTFTQELIPSDKTNKTISFTSFSVDGEIKTSWMGEKIREHPLQFGTATFCRSVMIEGLYIPSGKLLKELNYTGVCEIEYLKDPRDSTYKLIEINARTWLWVELAKASGVDFALILYKFANALEIRYPATYKTDLYWINSLTDFAFVIQAILKRNLSLSDYFKSIKRKIIGAVYNREDILPFLLFPFLLTSRAFKKKF